MKLEVVLNAPYVWYAAALQKEQQLNKKSKPTNKNNKNTKTKPVKKTMKQKADNEFDPDQICQDCGQEDIGYGWLQCMFRKLLWHFANADVVGSEEDWKDKDCMCQLFLT